MYGGYRCFQRFAGSTERAPDAGLTLMLRSGRASQVNSLGARAQSCICWTSEAQALPVPGSPFWKFAGKFWSSQASKFTSRKQSRGLCGGKDERR